MAIDHITSPDAPAPIGPYSQAARAPQGIIYLSGQTPIDPTTGKLVDGGIAEQTRQVFANLSAVLTAAGSDWDHVVKINVFLTDMADFAAMNEVYASVFPGEAPARTTVAVAGLPLGANVEIELQAISADS